MALLVCAAIAAAALRHTGSLAFPIDDGYIYSNYVLNASQGHPFAYNPGEQSGGITGLGWFIVSTASYWLLAPFHALLTGLAPPIISGDPALAAQAGHLYLSAYLPGALALAATAVGVFRLSLLVIPGAGSAPKRTFCWLLGALAAAHLGFAWGAMSGLEVSLSTAFGVWAITLLIEDVRAGRLRWSLLLAALTPWARPDLVVIPLMGTLWLLVRTLVSRGERRQINMLAIYVVAAAAGFALMSTVYFVGWGKPLPSSFYAKVGGLRLGTRFFSATAEIVAAGRVLPFAGAALALLGGIIQMLPSRSPRAEHGETRWAALLVLLAGAGYVAALMLTIPWFGQEDRYLLPAQPFALVLVGSLAWRVLSLFAGRWSWGFPRHLRIVAGALVMLALVGANYVWATRNYAVQVRNMADGHIKPAVWLTANTPPDAIVASEPIGAVQLFSGRRTVDLVGLTTPATLGTYRDWPTAWPALRDAGSQYLLFYPAWFDGGKAPSWVTLLAKFPIPDNRIAGDSTIAIYGLEWSKMPH